MAGAQPTTPVALSEANVIPGFITDKRPKYNGVPYNGFRNGYWMPLISMLGNIIQDGWSMRDTYNGDDPGGRNYGAAPTANQQTQHGARSRRLAALGLNCCEPDTDFYLDLEQNYFPETQKQIPSSSAK